MAHANTLDRFHLNHSQADAAADARAAAGPGFWRRLLDAMMESRRRQAEREIAFHLENADVLTDDVERRLGERMTGATHFMR